MEKEKTLQEIIQEYSNPIQRIAFLKDNSDKVVKKGYSKNFTPAELQGYKEKLITLCDDIERLEDEKKSAMKQFKSDIDPLVDKRKEMIGNIRRKSKFVEEICYQFTDAKKRTTEFYNEDGECIESRPATADELSPTIYSINRATGTDDV